MKIDTTKIPNGFVSTMTPTLGHEIHALEGGSKDFDQQIVMIHGAIASRRYLVPTAILLAKSMQVFVPEMPGHGASSKPRRALTVEQQVDVLFKWFQLKGLKQTNVFANSYGCQVASQLIATHPEIACSLTLSDPTADPTGRTLIKEAYRLYIDGFSEPKGSQSQFIADVTDMGIPLAFETIQQMIQNDIRPNLAKITCRTLVVRGEKDPIAPQRWTEEVARRIPNARLCVIPNAPHCVNYATPSQLTSVLLEFINEPNMDRVVTVAQS
jgi:pimeloyl-ACP methyl ester carboxylesterase